MVAKSKILFLSLLPAIPLAASALERVSLLPPETLIRLQVTNVAEMRAELDRMYLSKLRQDEQFQAFSVAFAKKIKTRAEEGKEGLLDPFLYEHLLMLKGEAVFALKEDKKGSGTSHTYFSAAMTAEEYTESLRRGHWVQSEEEALVEIVKSSFQGVEIVQHIAQGGTPEEQIFHWSHLNGTFLLADQREWVEKCIVQLKKEHVAEPGGNTLRLNLPLGPLLFHSALQKKTNDVERVQAEQLYCALGLAGIDHYELKVEINGDEVVLDSTLEISDPSQGIFTLLDTTPRNLGKNEYLPVPFSSFMVGQINLARFWNNLPEILTATPPATAAQFAMAIRTVQQKTGLDIGQDLLAHLGTRFSLSTQRQNDGQSWIVAFDLQDEYSMKQSLETLFSSPLVQPWIHIISISDFRGHVIYGLKSKNPAANPASLCTANGQLLLGNADLVRETIQRQEGGAQSNLSKMELAARRHAPPNAFGLGATDHRETASMLNIKVSDSSFSAGFGVTVNKDPEDARQELGENEISLNYVALFLQNTYHFAEAVPGGIHHRVILEYKEIKGEKP